MPKQDVSQITKKEKEAIAEQLANFFFGYWEARSNSPKTNDTRKGEAIVLASGLPRNFPDQSRTMA